MGRRSPFAGTFDQCSLLTAAEVETALSRNVVSSGPDPSGLSRCLWVLEPAAENRTVGVTVYLTVPRAAANDAFETIDANPVTGLGDAAGYNIRTGGDYVLNVLRGDDYFRLQASIGARPDSGSLDFLELPGARPTDPLSNLKDPRAGAIGQASI